MKTLDRSFEGMGWMVLEIGLGSGPAWKTEGFRRGGYVLEERVCCQESLALELANAGVFLTSRSDALSFISIYGYRNREGKICFKAWRNVSRVVSDGRQEDTIAH